MTTTSDVKLVSQPPLLRLLAGIFLSVFGGGMLLLAFPPYGLWPLAWFALIPVLVAQYRVLPARWTSLAQALMLLVWLGPYLRRLFGSDYGPVFEFMGVWVAILMFFIQKDRKFHDLTGYRWFVFQGLAGWVGFEMVRAAFIPLVATSGFIGYTQAMQAWLFQPVSLFSIYGFDLVIMLVNYVLAQMVMAWLDGRWRPADVVLIQPGMVRRWLVVMGAMLVGWVGLSLVLLFTAPSDAPTIRVASLRPDYPLPAFQDDVNTSEMRFATFAAQAREAAAQGAKILYTPEMLFNFDPQEEFPQEFRSLAQETDTYIFVLYTVVRDGEPFRNQAVLLSPSGEFSEPYSKNHVPPGEPLFVVTNRYPVYETPMGRLAAIICHDTNYTDVSRKVARNGAQLIGAGFKEFGGFGEQLWTHATFRAVETHTSLVVTGVATVSAIIDPYGRQIALDVDPQGSPKVLVADVPLGSGNAPYNYLGDVLGWLSLAGFVFFIVFQAVLENRAKKAAHLQVTPAN